MSARKQMFAPNPCQCWWQLNPGSSSVHLQGSFTHSPEFGIQVLMKLPAHFSPQNWELEGKGKLQALAHCASSAVVALTAPRIPKFPIREAGLMILILQSFTANTQWLFLQFWVSLFERHPKKSHFQSHTALLSLLYRMWSLSLPSEQEALSAPIPHETRNYFSLVLFLAFKAGPELWPSTSWHCC